MTEKSDLSAMIDRVGQIEETIGYEAGFSTPLLSELTEELLPAIARSLAQARLDYDVAGASKAVILDRPEVKQAFEAVSEAIKTRTATEAALRTAALIAYAQTGDLEPVGGVKIVQQEAIEYYEIDAVEWAEHNAPAIIEKAVDKKAFEAIIKTLPEAKRPPFVTVKKEPAVRISSKLAG